MTEEQFTQIIQRLDQIFKALPTNGRPTPLLETIREIAEYCRKSQSTIRRWIKDEAFPAHKALKKYQVSPQQIDAWRVARAKVKHGIDLYGLKAMKVVEYLER